MYAKSLSYIKNLDSIKARVVVVNRVRQSSSPFLQLKCLRATLNELSNRVIASTLSQSRIALSPLRTTSAFLSLIADGPSKRIIYLI